MAIAISPLVLSKRILIAALAALALVYCGDYLFLRLRMLNPKPADPFESIKSLRVLAIPEKNGKTEYEVDARIQSRPSRASILFSRTPAFRLAGTSSPGSTSRSPCDRFSFGDSRSSDREDGK